MRTIYLSLFCIFIFASCRQDMAEFSCDPVLNDYVSANKETLKQITISELASSDLAFQQAVFRSFDAVKKREIWLNKIQILLETQEYSEDAYLHITKLFDYISVGFFEKDNIDSHSKENAEFASDWIKYAKNNLGWSNKDVAFVIYRLYTKQDQFNAELNSLIKIQQKATTNSECNCNSSTDFCFGSCNAGSCAISSACGFAWSQECNGVCN